MNELKHNAFLKLNASLPECRSLERHSLSFLNSAKRFLRKRFRSFEVTKASHSPWVVRRVALETQHNAFLNSASRFYGRSTGRVVRLSYLYFIKTKSGLKAKS
ncbi:hypothetical protein B1J93_14620 [Leptospira kirschneri serovar Pomona]|uniref:Uncharacterized protein n=1 Tax=Leptospira kirschneri serovar Pomona TaxID=561005 RepID=A0A1T1DJL8_9LEPT|nr:hypothetical protein B1J93_14620 [Leptospira kirschneri serovar Pomona]